jgi:hypothetical protein
MKEFTLTMSPQLFERGEKVKIGNEVFVVTKVTGNILTVSKPFDWLFVFLVSSVTLAMVAAFLLLFFGVD